MKPLDLSVSILAICAAALPAIAYAQSAEEPQPSGPDLIGFSAASIDDLHALFAKIEASGARIISAPVPTGHPGGGVAFRAFDPDGHAFEVSAGAAPRTVEPMADRDAVPLQISHIVLHSPDHNALETWYRQVLGFCLSDWLGDFMVFLRCNSAHHRLAILPGPRPMATRSNTPRTSSMWMRTPRRPGFMSPDLKPWTDGGPAGLFRATSLTQKCSPIRAFGRFRHDRVCTCHRGRDCGHERRTGARPPGCAHDHDRRRSQLARLWRRDQRHRHVPQGRWTTLAS